MTWNPGGNGRPGGPRGSRPPDLEALLEQALREGRARLRKILPGGLGGRGVGVLPVGGAQAVGERVADAEHRPGTVRAGGRLRARGPEDERHDLQGEFEGDERGGNAEEHEQQTARSAHVRTISAGRGIRGDHRHPRAPASRNSG